MRQVGKFRFLMRRPPAPKIEDSGDLVNLRYAAEPYPAPVPVPRRQRKPTVSAPESLKDFWDRALDEGAFLEGRRPAAVAAEVAAEQEPTVTSASIDRHATFMVLRQYMRGDTSFCPDHDRFLAQLVDSLCDLRCSARRAFDEVTRRQMSADLIGYVYRAARHLGALTDTIKPGLASLDQALIDAGVLPVPVDDGDVAQADEPPMQVTVPRNNRR